MCAPTVNQAWQAPATWNEPTKLTQEQAAAFFSNKGLSESRHAWQAIFISCMANLAVFSLCRYIHPASRLGVPENRALHWSQRAMKATNGIMTASGCLLCLTYARPASAQWHFGYTLIDEVAPSVLLGFLVSDTLLMAALRPLRCAFNLVHHLIFGALITFHLCNGCVFKLHYLWLSLGDIVVPFLQLRWHLAVTNNKGTILHDLTLVALWIAFGISRPITMLLGLKSTWSLLWQVHIPAVPINHLSQYVMWCVLVAGYVLNLFWFLKISGLAWCAACKLLKQVLDSNKVGILAQIT